MWTLVWSFLKKKCFAFFPMLSFNSWIPAIMVKWTLHWPSLTWQNSLQLLLTWPHTISHINYWPIVSYLLWLMSPRRSLGSCCPATPLYPSPITSTSSASWTSHQTTSSLACGTLLMWGPFRESSGLFALPLYTYNFLLQLQLTQYDGSIPDARDIFNKTCEISTTLRYTSESGVYIGPSQVQQAIPIATSGLMTFSLIIQQNVSSVTFSVSFIHIRQIHHWSMTLCGVVIHRSFIYENFISTKYIKWLSFWFTSLDLTPQVQCMDRKVSVYKSSIGKFKSATDRGIQISLENADGAIKVCFLALKSSYYYVFFLA